METTTSNQGLANPVQPRKVGKVRGGYLVIAESFKLLNKNRSAVLFPIFAAIASIVVIAAGVLAFMSFNIGPNSFQFVPNKTANDVLIYAAYFFFYLTVTFIASFFQAGLVISVSAQINGRKISFGEAMGNTGKHIGKILVWSIVWATVGVVMNIIEDKTKLAGKIATAIFGAAWGIATFFIVPVLVLENGSVRVSLKRSVEIFRKKWGETIIANLATSLYFVFFWALGLVLFVGYLFLAAPDPYLVILATVLFVVFSAMLVVISSTVEGIYRVILYEYAANNRVPQGFPQELVER